MRRSGFPALSPSHVELDAGYYINVPAAQMAGISETLYLKSEIICYNVAPFSTDEPWC